MLRIIDKVFSDKMYLYLIAGTGAYFVHKDLLSLAYLNLVLVMVLINKINRNEQNNTRV